VPRSPRWRAAKRERDLEIRVLEVHQHAERPDEVVRRAQVETGERLDVADPRVALLETGLLELAQRLFDDLGAHVDTRVVPAER
jgi:hypothetical protein